MDKKNTLFPNKKEKWDFVIAIIVILLVGFFVYNKVFNNSEESVNSLSANNEIFTVNDSYDNEEEILIEDEQYDNSVDSNINEEELFVEISNESNLNDIEVENKSMYIKPILGAKFFKNSKLDDDLEDAEIIKEFDKKEIEEKVSDIEEVDEVFENETITKEPETHIEENKDLTTTENIEPEKEVEKAVIKKKEAVTKHRSNASTDCTIVIGAFGEEGNKMKTVDKLKSLGYAHDEGVMNNGLIYVGVPVMCADKTEKRRLINELNKSFNVQSWVKKK